MNAGDKQTFDVVERSARRYASEITTQADRAVSYRVAHYSDSRCAAGDLARRNVRARRSMRGYGNSRRNVGPASRQTKCRQHLKNPEALPAAGSSMNSA
jgi:hypothetical protein